MEEQRRRLQTGKIIHDTVKKGKNRKRRMVTIEDEEIWDKVGKGKFGKGWVKSTFTIWCKDTSNATDKARTPRVVGQVV